MMYINEWDIDEAMRRHQSGVAGMAARFLAELRVQTNQVSDGWAYWTKPVRAAKKLMELIQQADKSMRSASTGAPVPMPTQADLKRALAPIKSFYTRVGYGAGMKWPAVYVGE